MNVYQSLNDVRPLSRSIVTIGNFDGVHLGHRKLIETVVDEARNRRVESVLLTFDPHPVQVLYPDRKLQRIFDREDQIEQIRNLGIQHMIIEPFTRDLSQMSAEEFMSSSVFKPFSPELLIVGYDFSFGANRSGGITQLLELSKLWNFELKVIPPVKINGVVASSSRVRQDVLTGNIQEANALLGRNYYLKGVVERGDQRGRSIGFPTANIFTTAELLPNTGVYKTRTLMDQMPYDSVTNVGVHPTFVQSQTIKIETHILDFDKDIYGRTIFIEFISKLREEIKFDSVDELKAQIKQDIIKAKKL